MSVTRAKYLPEGEEDVSTRVGPMESGTDPRLPTLLGITLRRSMVVGRMSLVIGGGMVVFYSALFGIAGPLFVSVGTVILPVFAVSGGIGGALVFTNDRTKGVLEYLVAYGISPRRILANALIAGIVQVTIILGVGLAAGLTAYLLSGNALTSTLPEILLGYTFPMSYLSVTLMTTIGVFWTSLSSPRSGLNSPLGILPLIGVLPTTLLMIVAIALGAEASRVLLVGELVVFVLLASLLARTDRFMPTERLLSPA